MKVKIEIEEGLEEEEVIIRCASLNDSVVGLQNYLSKLNDGKLCLSRLRKSISLRRRGGSCGRTQRIKFSPAITSCMSWRRFCREVL